MDIMAWNTTKSIDLIRIGLIGILGLLLGAACEEPAGRNSSLPEAPVMAGRSEDSKLVHLYFSDSDHTVLQSEQRTLPAGFQPEEAGVQIIQALLEGPKKRLERTITEGTRLRGFYILKNRTAYIDLSNEIRDRHPGGARSELLTIYSIVNTLTMNMTEILRPS